MFRVRSRPQDISLYVGKCWKTTTKSKVWVILDSSVSVKHSTCGCTGAHMCKMIQLQVSFFFLGLQYEKGPAEMAIRTTWLPLTSVSHPSAHSLQYSAESLHWWMAKKKKKTIAILSWDPEKHWIRKLMFYISPAKNSNLKWQSIPKDSYYGHILFGLWQYIFYFLKSF